MIEGNSIECLCVLNAKAFTKRMGRVFAETAHGVGLEANIQYGRPASSTQKTKLHPSWKRKMQY